MSKLFAIGDIHGCHRKLTTLLGRLPLNHDEDTLIFLGDYINRGPDSRKVLDALIEIARRCRHVVFLKGNHEEALLDYALAGEPEDLGSLRAMGVDATAESYNVPLRRLIDLSCMPSEHQQFLFDLTPTYSHGPYLFAHADYQPALARGASPPPDDMSVQGRARRRLAEATMLSSRRLGGEEPIVHPAGSVIVFGHLPYATPLVRPDRIGIDTGAVYGNMLTAVQLPERIFYHA